MAARLDAFDVTPGHVGGRAGDAGVNEHQVGLQLRHAFGGQDERGDLDLAVGVELDVPQAAVGRHHLVLRADGLLEHVLFDVDAFAAPAGFCVAISPRRACRACSRPTVNAELEPMPLRAGRSPSWCSSTPRSIRRQRSVSRTAGWRISSMALAVLDLAVDDAEAVLEERRQIAASEIAIFVDGRGQDGPAVAAIPAGVVGPAAEEGDAEGGSADDHSLTFAGNAISPPPRRSIAGVLRAVRGRG